MAVRILGRLAQVFGDGFFQARADGVLQRLGLGVDLAPVEAERARQQQFDEPVAADDAPRGGDALGGERRLVAGRVGDEAGFGEPLEHPGNRRGLDAGAGGDVAGGDRAVRAAELVNLLEVVLDGGRRRGHRCAPARSSSKNRAARSHAPGTATASRKVRNSATTASRASGRRNQ